MPTFLCNICSKRGEYLPTMLIKTAISEKQQHIEQAILIEKSAIKDKTWRYRGEIYFNIATNPEVSAEYPNALVTARDSYLKARELDVKGRYETEILNGLAGIQIQASNLGIEGYNTQTFDKAGSNFDLAAEIARSFNQVDTMAVYNAALCYEKAEIYDLAIARYYKGALRLNTRCLTFFPFH